MKNNSRYVRARVRRKLREEAGFGCAFSGNPLIENAHIIEYSKTKKNSFENMIALCPV
ncbi:MAG: HNH endonuclease [Nitrososphaeraceae archaeon]